MESGVRGALRASGLGGGEFVLRAVGEPGDDLVLHVEEFGRGLSKRSAHTWLPVSVSALDIDAKTISPRCTAFQHVAHVEFTPDLPASTSFPCM